jgi:hypothetical protein
MSASCSKVPGGTGFVIFFASLFRRSAKATNSGDMVEIDFERDAIFYRCLHFPISSFDAARRRTVG